jgi:hypothetical protein
VVSSGWTPRSIAFFLFNQCFLPRISCDYSTRIGLRKQVPKTHDIVATSRGVCSYPLEGVGGASMSQSSVGLVGGPLYLSLVPGPAVRQTLLLVIGGAIWSTGLRFCLAAGGFRFSLLSRTVLFSSNRSSLSEPPCPCFCLNSRRFEMSMELETFCSIALGSSFTFVASRSRVAAATLVVCITSFKILVAVRLEQPSLPTFSKSGLVTIWSARDEPRIEEQASRRRSFSVPREISRKLQDQPVIYSIGLAKMVTEKHP